MNVVAINTIAIMSSLRGLRRAHQLVRAPSSTKYKLGIIAHEYGGSMLEHCPPSQVKYSVRVTLSDHAGRLEFIVSVQ